MKISKISIAIAFAFLGGCVTAPTTPPSIAFNYSTTNAGGVGIVQVFEMGGNTVVQIKNLQDKTPLFLGEGNVEMKYQAMGETAVLPGIVRKFTVVSAGAWAQVTRQSGVEAAQAAGKIPPTAPLKAKPLPTDDELRDQIAAMKAEIASLRKRMGQLGAEQSQQGATEAPVTVPEAKKPNYAPISSVKESTTLRVTFKDNSSEFEPRSSLARKLVELAEQASEISVTGYTDSSSQNPASTALAKGRAISARQFLISNGVDKSKILVSYKPAGGFVADNTTKDGRDQNRRVEIELL
ncbi:OmpA family protein [Rugamonas sp. A1-17]|nr:OmpA family protein [Rugamonas sp. A1-17]